MDYPTIDLAADSRPFQRQATRASVIAVMTAACIVSNYLLIGVFNVKLMDLIVFSSGFLFGPPVGASVGIPPWLVYGTLNPYGLSFPVLVATPFMESLYGIVGGFLEDVEDPTFSINMMIDYGDDNIVWLNDTRVPLDINLLKAQELLANIEYTPSEFGAFVSKVDGVGDDPTKLWLWFYYDTEADSWAYGPSAADFWVLHDGDVVSWEYTSP